MNRKSFSFSFSEQKERFHLVLRFSAERILTVTFRVGMVMLFCLIGGYWASRIVEDRLSAAEIETTRALIAAPVSRSLFPESRERPLTLRDFVAGDPFKAEKPSAEPVKEEVREITAGELLDLEGIRLAGTLPGISVWVEEKGKQSIVLKGQKLKGYELVAVEDDRIILHKGATTLTVLLRYSIPGQRPKSPAPAVRTPPQSISSGNLTAARPGEQGSVSRELVNKLLMDPLDEMKKFRLRPKFDGGAAQGVEVQWLDNGSVLTSLGVQTGDVVQSVNGVEIRNMGDIVNVINSLMGGDNFDVNVVRNGSPVSLKYNIK